MLSSSKDETETREKESRSYGYRASSGHSSADYKAISSNPGGNSFSPGEVEEMMEYDPCLASCCIREMQQNKKNRIALDAIRTAMPAALVNKNWITPSEQGEHRDNCSCCASDAERAEKNAHRQAARRRELDDDERQRSDDEGDEQDIDALLAEVDDDLEMIQIRDERMKQLKAAAEASQQKLHQAHSNRAGELVDIPAAALLRLVNVQDYMVVLLRSADGGSRHGSGDDVPTQVILEKHLRKFAPDFLATMMVTVTVGGGGQSKEGDKLLRTIRCEVLPAVVCFREGVIVARAAGNMRQFVQMGEIGEAVFRAWLWQTRVLKDKVDPREKPRSSGDGDDSISAGASSKSSTRAVFQNRGDGAGMCADPTCKHEYRHEHLAVVEADDDDDDD